MSRDGADGAPPMRKRVRAARLTLAHASGLRYAFLWFRPTPRSTLDVFGHPRPVNGTAFLSSPRNVEARAEARAWTEAQKTLPTSPLA